MVKSLKFGTQYPFRRKQEGRMEEVMEGLSALEDRTYLTESLHSAPHHYIKVGKRGSDAVCFGVDELGRWLLVNSRPHGMVGWWW